MKKFWKTTQYVLLILVFLITIFNIFVTNDLGLTIRGILLTLYLCSVTLEDKLVNKYKISETTFHVFRTIIIIVVFLVAFKL